MSSFLKSLDDEAAYLEAGLERTRAELERIQKRLAANREERRRVATQSQSSRDGTIMPGDLPHVAPSASTAAPSAAARPEKKRKANKVTPLPEYNFFLSVGGDLLNAEELTCDAVARSLMSRFEHEVDNRPEKYREALLNPATHHYGHSRQCLNDEPPIQDPDVACCYCTEHKMPCMRLELDDVFGLGLCAAPLAPSLREGREWHELEYWMLP
jgi:hypothetical protein